MTRQEWLEEADRYQRLIDQAKAAKEDEHPETVVADLERQIERYEVKRDACYANSVYGTEGE